MDLTEIASSAEDRPLWSHTPLASVRARRPVRKPLHWTLFSLSALIGFTPIFVGGYYGISAASSALTGDTVLPWWGVALGLVLALVCLGAFVLNAYAIMEVKMKALLLALLFSLLAWPGVATLGFVLTYVAPETPMSEGLCSGPADTNGPCSWD